MVDRLSTPPVKQKHPRLLYVLFFAEMWERFAYYLLQAMMILYLTKRLNVPKSEVAGFWGYYVALVYFFPIVGGLLADKVLGFRRVVVLGAILMAIGYTGLTIVSYSAMVFSTSVKWSLYTSLCISAIGNGIFKPNIGAMVGNLYPQGDPRRDSAFSIFYMGVNIGAFFAPLVGSFLKENLAHGQGWYFAFMATAVGMVIGLFNILFFYKKLAVADLRSSVSAAMQVALPKEYQDPRDPPALEKRKIISILIMCLVGAAFWMAFHNNSTSLTFWAAEHTKLNIGSWKVNPEIFQSVNPFFIVVLTPIIVLFHAHLRRKGKEITTPVKIMIGLLLIALAYVAMVGTCILGGHTIGPCAQCLYSDDSILSYFFIGVHRGEMNMSWLILTYFITTVGELYFSPLGLSLITKMAPARMTGLMVGCWWGAVALGNLAVGKTGEYFWQKWPHSKYFAMLSVCCVFAAAIIFVALPYIRKALPKEKQE